MKFLILEEKLLPHLNTNLLVSKTDENKWLMLSVWKSVKNYKST